MHGYSRCFYPPSPYLSSGETPALYTVLPEKTASVGGAMMGSSHVYDMASAVPGALKKVSQYVRMVLATNLLQLIVIIIIMRLLHFLFPDVWLIS